MKVMSKIELSMIEVLKDIAETLEKNRIKWCVLGSCALALHGVNIRPSDIDILTDNDGVLFICNLFKKYKVSFVQNETSSGMFESSLARFFINLVFVEVMGDLKYKSKFDNKWHNLDIFSVAPTMVETYGFKIPVAPLCLLLVLYERWRRDKDIIKIEMIKNEERAICCQNY